MACAGGAGDECAGWPTGGQPLSLVILMDATDGLSRAQREDVWSRIRPLAERAPPGSSLHLFEVRPGADAFREVAAIPRPPHPCEVDHWSDNPDQRAAQWAPAYLRPLRDALGAAARANPSDSSPILEGIQAAARRFGEEGADGHLVLVSDLMQHTGALSFYRGVPTLADFRASPLYREMRTRRLEGVALTVLQLPPGGAATGREAAVRAFWTAWFQDQGMVGVGEAFLPVEGPRARN